MNVKILPSDWNMANFSIENPNYYSILRTDLSIDGFMRDRVRPSGCFSIVVNPQSEDFLDRLTDFTVYENSHGRCVLIHSPDFDIERSLAYRCYPSDHVRKTDPAFAVHSTLLTSYEKIIKDGHLKSTSRLNKEGILKKAIGVEQLGEPQDYLNYIMFAVLDGKGSGSELLVNSHLMGKICFDPDVPYVPQARMYFDVHKMIKDGLVIRDGVHLAKVFDTLPLNDYLLLTVLEKDVILPDGETHWTPSLFKKYANDFFFTEIIGKNTIPRNQEEKL